MTQSKQNSNRNNFDVVTAIRRFMYEGKDIYIPLSSKERKIHINGRPVCEATNYEAINIRLPECQAQIIAKLKERNLL